MDADSTVRFEYVEPNADDAPDSGEPAPVSSPSAPDEDVTVVTVEPDETAPETGAPASAPAAPARGDDGDVATKEPDETADALLRRAAGHSPDAIAFADPPNRAAFDMGPGRSISYREADALADRIAARFAAFGLKRGDVVALQLPNLSEGPLLIAGAWRAGLVPVPLPMMWRLNEIHHALAQIDPAALVTVGRFAEMDHAALMCEAASRHMNIRYIFGLGSELPDGTTPIADWFSPGAPAENVADELPAPGSGSDLAILTWAASPEGPYPVPRSHAELIALGQIVVQELHLTRKDVLLNTYPMTSISVIGGQLIASMLAGAALILHQPFDYDGFVSQLRDRGVTFMAVPDPVLKALGERGDLADPDLKLARIGRVWPWPHGTGADAGLPEITLPVYDIHNLGELALVISRSTAKPDEARRGGLPLGKFTIPGGGGDDRVYLETRVRGSVANGDNRRRLSGQLFLRGTIVPAGPFDKAGALTNALLRADAQGFLNTHIRCTVDEAVAGVFSCDRDLDMIYHGGVAVGAAELDRIYADYPDFLDAAAFAIGDEIMGDRIFAAIVPRPDQTPSLANFRRFLEQKGVAPYKAPDQLVIVSAIPRDGDGRILRDQVLNQV